MGGTPKCTRLDASNFAVYGGSRCEDFYIYYSATAEHRVCYSSGSSCRNSDKFSCAPPTMPPPTPPPPVTPFTCSSLGDRTAVDALGLSSPKCSTLKAKRFASYGGSACDDFFQTDGDGRHRKCYRKNASSKPCRTESEKLVCEPPSAPPSAPPPVPPFAPPIPLYHLSATDSKCPQLGGYRIGSPLATSSDIDLAQCARECGFEAACVAFSFTDEAVNAEPWCTLCNVVAPVEFHAGVDHYVLGASP